MSLLLSLLGTTALLGATAVTPAIATLPKAEQQVEAQRIKTGIYQINETINAEAIASDNSDDVQEVRVSIPWTDLGIDMADYLNINWARTSFRLSMETYFQDDFNWTSGVSQNKVETFNNLKSGFSSKIVYNNGPVNSDPNVKDNNGIEYFFVDDFVNININAKIWISIQGNNPEYLYSKITFLNIIYSIVVY